MAQSAMDRIPAVCGHLKSHKTMLWSRLQRLGSQLGWEREEIEAFTKEGFLL